MDLLSDVGLSLPGFGALPSLPTQYLAASSESIYVHEFVMLSKHLGTSVRLESESSTSSRSELWRPVREEQLPSQWSDVAFKPEHSVCRCAHTVSSSLHLCRMTVQEYKILIGCSLTWVPVFHTL